VTTRDPGASDVFTHGLRDKPFATAFRANNPAPIMTEGLLVLVQLVIAAMTTAPSVIDVPLPSFTATVGPAEVRPNPLPS